MLEEKKTGNPYKNDPKIIKFYEDKPKTKIKKEYLDGQAKQWARSFIKHSDDRDDLTSTQLRRFHNDVRSVEAKVKAAISNYGEEEGFLRMLPFIKMIKSKIAYACPPKKKDRKVPIEFRNYMETMINSIEDYDDFKAFSLCFEAVVGYFYGEGGR
ncbi:MAG: type III-A CRISPR-associated protein Csm2 [bacterium]|nr:type III-A CRISPR-associated protein Csm2 [bacterium]